LKRFLSGDIPIQLGQAVEALVLGQGVPVSEVLGQVLASQVLGRVRVWVGAQVSAQWDQAWNKWLLLLRFQRLSSCLL